MLIQEEQPMQIEQFKTIYISIIYNKQEWHILIDKLYSVLERVNNICNQSKTIIHFNYNLKENVGLTLIVPIEQAKPILQIIHKEINLFLKQHPSKSKRSTINSKYKLFKDIPSNTLHYNLHKFPTIYQTKLLAESQTSLSSKVSSIILEYLRDEPIEDLSLYTLSFYFQLILLRSFFNTIAECRKYLILSIKADTELKDKNEAIYNGFFSNSMVFSDIMDDIFNKNIWMDKDNRWMLEWLKSCQETIKQDILINDPEHLNSISSLINKQLGLGLDFHKVWFKLIVNSTKS